MGQFWAPISSLQSIAGRITLVEQPKKAVSHPDMLILDPAFPFRCCFPSGLQSNITIPTKQRLGRFLNLGKLIVFIHRILTGVYNPACGRFRFPCLAIMIPLYETTQQDLKLAGTHSSSQETPETSYHPALGGT